MHKKKIPAVEREEDKQVIEIPNNIIEEENKNENDPPIEPLPERPISSSSSKTRRTVSFAEELNVFYENKDIDHEVYYQQPVFKEKIIPTKPRLPSANETTVDQMDSNLRMLIVKELSKDTQVFQPSSRKSSFRLDDHPSFISLIRFTFS